MSFFSNLLGNSKKLRRVRNSRSARPSTERKARLDFLALEERVVPAVTASLNGSTLQIGYGTAADTATITTDTLGNIIVNGTGLSAFTTPAASITQISAIGTGNADNESLVFSAAAPISANVASTGVATVNINSPLNVTTLSVSATHITSNATGTIAIASGGLADFTNADTTSTLVGSITGAGGISHEGTGTLVLAASNGYSGGTTINAGALTSTSSLSLGSGPVFEAGGTLNVQGSSAYTNAVNVQAGSTATTNVIASPSTVAMGPLTMGAGATLNVAGSVPALTGFGGSGTGWTANGGATVASDVLSITTQVNNEARSFWYNNQLPVGTFNVSYDYTSTSGGADGSAFVIQTVGTAALGGAGGSLGYNGITGNSYAVEFNVYSPNTVGYKFSTNGTTGGYTAISSTSGTLTGSPINLVSGSPIHVNLNYNGSVLTMTLTDNSGDKFVTTNTVNLATTIGTPNAYFGFTGGTGGANSLQTISNFVAVGAAVPPTSYGLSFSGTNLAGSNTISVANATFGPGTLSLGPVNDGGVAATLNTSGTGTVLIPSAATSLVNGTTVSVAAGTLNLGATGALGSLAAVSVATGASVVLGASQTIGSLSGNGAVQLNGNTLTVGSTNNLSSTFAGAIADGSPVGGSLTKSGSGTLTLSGLSTYTGATTLASGVLAVNSVANIGSASALGASSGSGTNLVFAGGTLQYTGLSASSNRGFSINPGATGTISVGSNKLTLSGSVPASTGSLTKTGAGSLTLAGNDLATGLTTDNSGTLVVTGSLAGSVSVASAILSTGVNTTFGGGLTASGTTNIFVGGQNTTGTLTLGGDLTADTTSTINFDYISTSQFDTINAQNVNVAPSNPKIKFLGSNFVPGTYTLINFTGTYTGGVPTTASSGGNTFAFHKTSNALQVTITPSDVTPEWSVGGVSPIVDGAGTWDDGSTNFFDISNQNAGTVTWDNTQDYNVIFGAGGAGGAINVDAPVTANTILLGNVTTPYTFSGMPITLESGIIAGNTATIANPIVLDASQTFIINSTLPVSVTGVISETNAGTTLSLLGTGALFLGNNETYTGGTNITSGSIILGVNNALPTSNTTAPSAAALTLSTNANANLNLNGFSQTLTQISGGSSTGGSVTFGGGTLTLGDILGNDFTFTGTFGAGAGTLVKQGSDNLTLATSSPFNGTANVNGGTLTAAVANTFAAGATINVGSGDTLNVTAASAFSGDTINVLSGGTLTASLANGYSGATINILTGATVTDTLTNEFSGANLVVKTGGLFSVGTFASTLNGLSLQGGNVTGTGTLTSSTAYDAQAGSDTAILAGSVGLNKTTTGTVTLGSANTYTGATSVTAGTLAYGIANAVPTASAITVSGATTVLALSGFNGTAGTTTLQSGKIAGPGTLTVNSANTFALQSGTVTAVLAGSGAMNKTTTGTVFLGTAATYTGATNIQAGTLESGLTAGTGINNAVPTASAVTLGTTTTLGVYDLNNSNQTFTSITTAATTGLTSQVINSFASTTVPTLTINNSGAVTYAGFLGTGTAASTTGNAFNLVKTGAGNLILGGANSFNGALTVSAGILTSTVNLGLGSVTGTATIQNNAELSLSTTGTLSAVKNIVIQNGGMLSSDGTGIVILGDGTTNSAVALNGTSILQANTAFTLNTALVNGTATGSLLRIGVGALTLLSTGDTYAGGTTLASGQTIINAANANNVFGPNTTNTATPIILTGSTAAAAGILAANGPVTYAGAITVPGIGGFAELATGTANAFVINGNISLQTTGTLVGSGAGNVTVNGVVSDAVTSTLAPGLLEGALPGAIDTTDPNPGVVYNSSNTGTFVPNSGVTTVASMTTLALASAAGQPVISVNAITAADVVIGSVVTGTNVPSGATVLSVTGNTITLSTNIVTAITAGTVITFSSTFGGAVNGFRTGEVSATSTANVVDLQTNTGGPWFNPGTQTFIYTGQFNVPNTGGATTAVQFAEQIDDDALIKVDGVTVDNDTSWNTATTSGILNLTPGWHNIEVRLANGGGGAGAAGTQGTSINWNANYGFGAQGIAGAGQTALPAKAETAGSVNGADFIAPLDSGAGEVFQHIVGGNVTMAGTGTLLLANAANSYHGATTVNSGTLAVTNGGELGSTSGIIVGASGTVDAQTSLSQPVSLAGTLSSSVGTPTLSGALTLTANTAAIGGVGNETYSGPIAGAFSLNKVGSDTVTLTNNASTYTGTTNVNAGILDVTNLNALGATTAAAIVASGATLQLDGGANLTGKPITINGTGAGGIGALNSVNGNGTVGTVTLGSSAAIGSGTAGNTLTVNAIAMAGVSNLTFTGAGNITVNTAFGNGPKATSTGLSAQAYQGANASAVAAGTGINVDGKPDDLLAVQTQQNPFIGLGSTTSITGAPVGAGALLLSQGVNYPNTGGGNSTVADHANDAFYSLTGPKPDGTSNNQAEIYNGFITIPDTGYYTFYTASDDGSNLWLDLNGNGAYSTGGVADTASVTQLTGFTTTGGAVAASGTVSGTITGGTAQTATISEQIVSNDAAQGITAHSSSPILLTAGVYAIRIADNNGGGGLGMIASWQETPKTGVSTTVGFSAQPIPASAFTTLTVNNNVVSNSTGTVKLLGNNTYNGTTTVNSGTFEVDGTNASTATVNVTNATLAGIGTLPGAVNINAGATLSPGTLGGSATGILSIGGALTFAAAVPTPALNISINSAVAGTGFDQVAIGAAGSVAINGAALNLNIGTTVNNDPPTSVYSFIDLAGSSTSTGNFAGHAWGSAITVSGNTFIVSNSITNDGDSITNDVGLVHEPSNNYFVSSTWMGLAPGTVVTDPTLTDGQTATIFDPSTGLGNAFADIQPALVAGLTASSSITAYIVDPGTYTDTTLNQAANIVLQGSAITIGSLSDTGFANTSVTIPSGTALTVGDATATTYIGTLLGAGSIKVAGSLTVNQANVLSGPIEISSGTLQLGDGNAVGTFGTGKITVDALATLTFDEPSSAGTTTFTNALAGTGTIVEMGFSSAGAVALVGTGSTFTGGLSINGGRISLGSATSIGNPSNVTVNNGQFSFGTAANATFSGTLSLSGTGYSDSTIAGGAATGALLFTGSTNAWSGPVTINGSATIGAFGATGTISGAIGGGALTFGSGSTSTETVVLTNNGNNWSGATTIANNAAVNIGNNNTSGELSTSTSGITLAGATAFLNYDRTDTTTWGQNISGQGGIGIRHGGTLDLDGTVSNTTNLGSLVVGSGTLNLSSGETVNVSGVTDVGDNLNSGFTATSGTVTGIINVPTGTTLISNTLDAGNNSTTGVVAIGTVNQTGGTVTLTANGNVADGAGLRLGQYPTGTGNYSLSAGVFSIGNSKILGIAEDGTGSFIQTGGTASAFEIDVNTRTNALGTGTFTLNGGTFQVGAGGLTKDSGTATVNLGGGTLQATANFGIAVPVTLTGAVGAAVIDTNGHTIADTSLIGGAGTLSKINSGQLTLVGTNTYTGGTSVTGGTIGVYNNAALGTGAVTLNGGTLTAGILAGLLQGIIANNAFDTADANPGGAVTLNFLAGETNVEGNPAQSPWFNDPPGNQTIVYTGQFFVPTTPNSTTTAVQFSENVDDNTLIKVDGTQVDSDTQWNVATTSGILNLTPGWHNIEVRFGNGGGGAGAANNQNNGTNGQANWTATFGFGAQGIGGTGQTISPVTTAGDLNASDYSNPIDPGDGSLFRAGAATNIPNNIILGAAGGDIDVGNSGVVTFSGTVSGSGTLSKTSPGTAILTGANTYSGGTSINNTVTLSGTVTSTISGGTLASNNASGLGTLAAVTVGSGDTLSVGASQTVSALSGSGTVSLNGNVLTVGGTDNLSSTFGGVIADGAATGGGIIKAGTGSLTLTGASTFAGTAAVNAGSLIVNGSLSTSSTVSLQATGILGGVGTVGTVNNLAGVVNPGSTGSPGTLNVNNLTLGPGSLVLDLSDIAADSVNAISAANITGATLSLNVGAVTPGEVFTILTVPGTSGGLTGTFVGLDGTPDRDTITAGGTTFTISYTGGDGNDITLTAAGTTTGSVVSTVQNGGIAYVNSTLAQHQHSMVENLVYSFSQAVNLSAANFTLSGINGTTTAPNVVVSGSGTVWTVTFTGAGVNDATHSIGDGEYKLVLNDPVEGLSSNTYNFFRLLGDMDGDGTVSASDFSTLVGTFLRATNDPLYLGADDFDGDGLIGASDLSQFTSNFLKTLPNTNLLN